MKNIQIQKYHLLFLFVVIQYKKDFYAVIKNELSSNETSVSTSLVSRAWQYIKNWKNISEKNLFEFGICETCYRFRDLNCMCIFCIIITATVTQKKKKYKTHHLLYQFSITLMLYQNVITFCVIWTTTKKFQTSLSIFLLLAD